MGKHLCDAWETGITNVSRPVHSTEASPERNLQITLQTGLLSDQKSANFKLAMGIGGGGAVNIFRKFAPFYAMHAKFLDFKSPP